MTDILSKLSALTGPDREVDLLIMRWVENIGGPSKNALPYTASIDAAMTLVPEGMRWCVDTCDGAPRSFVEPPHPYEGQPYWGNHATAPAIALCIASLKARNL